MPFSFISEGFKFYKNFFYSYTIKTFPVFLLIGISTSAGETFLNDERFFTWGALFFIFTNMFLNPFIAVLSVLLVNDLISDSLKETIGYYLVSLQIFFKLFILSLALSLITLLGLFLFIIPGVYLASRLILAPFFLIIENCKIVESLDKSWQTTGTQQIQFVYLLLLYWFVLLIPYFLVISLFSVMLINEGATKIPFFLNVGLNSTLSYFQMVLLAFPLLFVFKGVRSSV